MEAVKEKVQLRKYPAYKNSGVEWLGEIPEHWNEVKLKFVADVRKGILPKILVSQPEEGLPPYLSMDYLRGGAEEIWVKDKNAISVEEGEILLLWDGSNAGEFINSRKGVISSTVAHLSFSKLDKYFSRFYCKVIERHLRNNTIGMGIPHVNSKILNNSTVLLPPNEEQTAIATFLDEKCGKIDTAIAQKQQLIELLKERKQIIIQNAVTKGLDPEVKMKDSGVEWIGEIPEHWEVKNLRYSFQFLNYKRIPLSAIEREKMQGKYPYYGASGIIDYVDDYIFNEKLILIAEDGANLLSKSTPLAFTAEGKYWVNNHAHILRPKNSGFLYWAEQLSLIDYTTVISGAAQPKLSRENLGSVKTIVPPKTEIKKIEEYIEEKNLKINESLLLQQQQIEKLKEYKSSLIDAAVTGKVKVN